MTVVNMPEQQGEKSKADNPVLETARRVLQTEAKGLAALSDFLNDTFAEAVDLIEGIEGRIIITGMGKSGHVARKIAATLSSTGTPAFFVHPAEASHGDMGMIVRGDVVLALSNSGEAKELNDLIEYTRRFAIPLISMTSKPESTLGTRSDIALLIPPVPEACPNGLAPTTSTTLMMALGDALAISLLERKGFTETDFKVFHPGGKLGQQLMKVSEIMHQGEQLPLASDTIPVAKAIDIISEKGFGCICLTRDDNTLSGILTDGDIRRHITADFLSKTAGDVMTQSPKTITPDTLVAEAMAIMNNTNKTFRNITVLPVVDDTGKPVGLLHIHDCLRAGFA